jgi:hypothetical protein
MWVFKRKLDKNGNVERWKARLVAKGYTQRHGIDYNEIYSPVAKLKSIRLLSALGAKFKLNAHQHDVPTAFLNGVLQEEIWMDQPKGYEIGNPLIYKCKLDKCLYGLKQSPREFYNLMHKYMTSQGFKRTKMDHCVYYFTASNGELIFVGIYVDDIISVGKGKEVDKFRKNLVERFKITAGGLLEWYLGMAFEQYPDGSISINQNQYIDQKLLEFKTWIGPEYKAFPIPLDYQQKLENAKDETETITGFPYREMVGSIMYAMTGTRPDLAAAVSIVSKYLDKHTKTHCEMVKHIYQYLKKNNHNSLYYPAGGEVILKGYVDSSYANDVNYQSRGGYCFTVGDCIVSWYSGTSKGTPPQSTAEAEYRAALAAANECIWLKQLLEELGFKQGCVSMYEDNTACIALTKNPQDHSRTKHIQMRYHAIRAYVDQKEMAFEYIDTEDQKADMFTKALSGVKIRSNMDLLNVKRMVESYDMP